jgi:hypothetical protein
VAVSTSLLVITRADHLTLEARENFVLATRLGDSGTSVVQNMVPEGIAADRRRGRSVHIAGHSRRGQT